MRRAIFALVLWLGWSAQIAAQNAAPVEMLYRALGFDEILVIMRDEGLAYGAEMQTDLLQGQGGARWPATVSGIYDTDRMADIVLNRLDSELAAADLAPMLSFFQSEIGERIVSLEVSARAAFLAPDVEEASRDAFEVMLDDNSKRADMIKLLVDEADLVESNVVGAMNSNYAFYIGLADGGGLPTALSEDEILADVWSQEAEIREDTTGWLYAYLNLAYQPLSDAELDAYTAFYISDAGQTLNRAIFAAFDEMFGAISYALGQSAADFLGGEEL